MNTTTKLAVVLVAVGVVLSAGPMFAFDSLSADRAVAVSAADASDAYLSVERIDTVVDDQNEAEEVVRITNNFGADIDLDADAAILGAGLEESSPFDGGLPAGESTTYAVTCEPGTGSGETDVEVVVDSATSDRMTVEGVSETVSVDRDCPGPSDPGGGFDSIYASDVSGFVTPGEERQEFRFTLAENREPGEQIEIDLSEPRNNGVNYDGTFWNGEDVRVESGNGNVWTSGNRIIYQVSAQDGHDDEIVVTAGSYSTDGDGGPYDVVFTRTGTNEQGTTQFEIDGEEGAADPFVEVTANDVQVDDDRQTFSFTAGKAIAAWETVDIDISDAQGNGIEYDWDVRLEQGPGNDDNVWRSGDIVFQANDEPNAGVEIVVSIGIDVTDDGGGPYEVTFIRTDTGDQTTDTFEIG